MPSKHVSDSTSEYSSGSTSEYSSPHKVQVLRIPANSSKLEIHKVNTVTLDKTEWKTISARTIELEAVLGHTPDLRHFEESGRIDLRYLHLFDRAPSKPGSTSPRRWYNTDGMYYLYKCITETPSKLPKNKSFGTCGKGRNYGDAFIFKVDPFDADSDGDAVYDSMDGFVQSLDQGGDAVKVLERMAEW